MKIIYQSRVWDEYEKPSIEVSDIVNVPSEELKNLLSSILLTLKDRKETDNIIALIKDHLNLIKPEEVAAIGNLKVKGTDIIHNGYSSWNSFKINGPIPEYQLKEINERTTFFIQIELPPILQLQVAAHNKKVKLESKRKAELKKQKALIKAKKLLKSVGEI